MPHEVMQSVLRDRFATWHGVASVLYLIECVLGLALVVHARPRTLSAGGRRLLGSCASEPRRLAARARCGLGGSGWSGVGVSGLRPVDDQDLADLLTGCCVAAPLADLAQHGLALRRGRRRRRGS